MNGRDLVLAAIGGGCDDFEPLVRALPLRRRDVRRHVEALLLEGLVEARSWRSGEVIEMGEPSTFNGRLLGLPYAELVSARGGMATFSPCARLVLSAAGATVLAATSVDAAAPGSPGPMVADHPG